MKSSSKKKVLFFYVKVGLFSTALFLMAMFLLVKAGVDSYTVAGWIKCYPLLFLLWIFVEQSYRRKKRSY